MRKLLAGSLVVLFGALVVACGDPNYEVNQVSSALITYPVTAKGQVMWPDGSVYRPIAGARVYVMDQDPFVDEVIATGVTDSDGRFDLSGVGGDPKLFWQDLSETKPDVYVRIVLSNSRSVVETEVLGIDWSAKTSVRNNASGNLDFGTFAFAPGNGQSASILFAYAQVTYDNFTALTKEPLIPAHDGWLGMLYPCTLAAGVPFTTEESIHWPGGYTHWAAVYHEFGLRIRNGQDGDFAHFLYDVARFSYMQQHWSTKPTNEGFAFEQGWGLYHSTLLDPSEDAIFKSWSAVDGGDSVEGNVAAKIYQDAQACGGFNAMWQTLKSASIHSYAEFETALKALYPSCFGGTKPPIDIGDHTPILLPGVAPVALEPVVTAASSEAALLAPDLRAIQTALEARLAGRPPDHPAVRAERLAARRTFRDAILATYRTELARQRAAIDGAPAAAQAALRAELDRAAARLNAAGSADRLEADLLPRALAVPVIELRPAAR